jgi:hypothetical protein
LIIYLGVLPPGRRPYGLEAAISAVKSYVSFLIRLAAFLAGGGAYMRLHLAGTVNPPKADYKP